MTLDYLCILLFRNMVLFYIQIKIFTFLRLFNTFFRLYINTIFYYCINSLGRRNAMYTIDNHKHAPPL